MWQDDGVVCFGGFTGDDGRGIGEDEECADGELGADVREVVYCGEVTGVWGVERTGEEEDVVFCGRRESWVKC